MKIPRYFFILGFSVFVTQQVPLNTIAQQREVLGKVIDAVTEEPIGYATISFSDKSRGVTASAADGTFKLIYRGTDLVIVVTAVGYTDTTYRILAGSSSPYIIRVEPDVSTIDEIVIKAPKRGKYRNKNNAAVEFMRKVIEARVSNNGRLLDSFHYQAYDKLAMSLSIANEKVEGSALLRKFPFLKERMDSILQPGRSLVPFFLSEKSSSMYYNNDKLTREDVLAFSENRIDQKFDEDGLDEFMDKIYGRPDLYDHDIQLGNRRFLSPIADQATLFYKFFLVDTVKTTTPWQMIVRVSPKNPEDALITGNIYVNLDSSYAVQRAELRVGNNVNINWVNDVAFDMEYQKTAANRYFLSRSTMSLDLGIFRKGMTVYGIKTFIASHEVKQRVFSSIPARKKRTSSEFNADMLSTLRPETLSVIEEAGLNNVDSLKNDRTFNKYMSLLSFLYSGYVDMGKVEIGPFTSAYSFNPVEGNRIRIGGRTSDSFSRRVVFENYIAHGDRDNRLKYMLGATVSLNENSIYTFPVRSIKAQYLYDAEIPGQELSFLSGDSFLLSFKRGVNNRMWYNRKWMVEYWHELENHLSFKAGFQVRNLEPGGTLHFQRGDVGLDQNLQVTEFTGEIRWAPNEKFFQGKRYRRIINEGMPIFSLRTAIGAKVLGGTESYSRFTFNASKRFYLSQLGFSDVQLEAGTLFGKVPYPLLAIHRANQTYAYELASYNLMNFMEFMSDRYAGLNVQHSFNGFFLNKIPLLKKLQLREVLSFKVLQGSLSSENDPTKSEGLYRFPMGDNGLSSASRFGDSPYIEGSIGLANIFKILRIDYVHRFTHLDAPAISQWGIRGKIYFEF